MSSIMSDSHGWCMSSEAVGRAFGSMVRHCWMKSIPRSDICPGSGSGGCCVAIPMWNMIAHSLSRLDHGLRPVVISRTTQPMDQISAAPRAPAPPLMTSGARYIGVPASEFMTAGPASPPPPPLIARVFAIVRLPLMMTLAAPKSTYLRTELAPSKMLSGLTSRCSTPLE